MSEKIFKIGVQIFDDNSIMLHYKDFLYKRVDLSFNLSCEGSNTLKALLVLGSEPVEDLIKEIASNLFHFGLSTAENFQILKEKKDEMGE